MDEDELVNHRAHHDGLSRQPGQYESAVLEAANYLTKKLCTPWCIAMSVPASYSSPSCHDCNRNPFLLQILHQID